MLRADHGFPVVKGLLDAARRPFDAAGLDIPWYTCFGNHDGLIQGNFPAKTTQLSALCTGPVKIITLPPGISQSDVLNALQHNQLDELLASILTLPGIRLVTPDPDRKSLSRTQVVQEYFNTTSSPSGHGFTAQNRRGRHGVLLLRPGRLPVRRDGLGEPQRLRRRLARPGAVRLAPGDDRQRRRTRP